jgi:hypothetical protein
MTFASTSQYRIRAGRVMPADQAADFRAFLLEEAKALQVRLQQVKPFAMTIPMVTHAHLPSAAQAAIDHLLVRGKRELRARIRVFISLLERKEDLSPQQAQRNFALLKMRFTALLDKLDIFADVITQRSEHYLASGFPAWTCWCRMRSG